MVKEFLAGAVSAILLSPPLKGGGLGGGHGREVRAEVKDCLPPARFRLRGLRFGGLKPAVAREGESLATSPCRGRKENLTNFPSIGGWWPFWTRPTTVQTSKDHHRSKI